MQADVVEHVRLDPRSAAAMRALVALGGNALTGPDGDARPVDQHAAISLAMQAVADVIYSDQVEVILTHGNGPQVGNLLVKNELAAAVVPSVPLDWCGAQTQGAIGLVILDALDAALRDRGCTNPKVAALVSRTIVDADDLRLTAPSKPIGRYVGSDHAGEMLRRGQTWMDFGDKGWRRVVASPEPLECVDAPAAALLLAAGYTVVCSGGGGVPVTRGPNGHLTSVEAVVDKDLTAALLAAQLRADVMVIATDVDAAMIGWDTPDAEPIGAVSAAGLRKLADDGCFATGSMLPKVEAACRFAESGGTSIITSINRITDALLGAAGTIVTR